MAPYCWAGSIARCMGVFTLKMLCLLGSVLWTFFQYQMTLAILVIAVQFYYPHKDATKVYVPKRIRKPNIILKHIFPVLKLWATWLEHQVTNIKVKVKPGRHNKLRQL